MDRQQQIIGGVGLVVLLTGWAWWVSQPEPELEAAQVVPAAATGVVGVASEADPVAPVRKMNPTKMKPLKMDMPQRQDLLARRQQAVAFQGAMHAIVKEAHAQCLDDYMADQPTDHDPELVLDALAVDGVLSEITLKAPESDVPEDVLDCITEVAWEGDWPLDEVAGERRYQRLFNAR
jgi:hypothetical protein